MDLVPTKEAFQVFSVGLSAIQETTNGVKKSLAYKKVRSAKIQAKKKLAAVAIGRLNRRKP